MTAPIIANTLLGLFQSTVANGARQTAVDINSASTDFSSSLTLRLAELQAHSLNFLLDSASPGSKPAADLGFLTDSARPQNTGHAIHNLSASGHNLSLFDPESAYSMMSVINSRDVIYKAQYSQLSEMTAAVADLQKAGQTLGAIDASADGASIQSRLQTFVGKYNEWIDRFDSTVKYGGLLAGTQAAEISLYELEQSVENVFNGAKDGFHGMRDLGVRIDPTTNLASIDLARLHSALTANPQGVANTIGEFSANFARSAELLISSNNFLPNRLANLDRAIDYIRENKPALQTEFGLGDPARPSPRVAAALAAYERIAGS